jgi:hypothetical protein
MVERHILVLAAFALFGLSGCISWTSPPEGWPARGAHVERDLGFAMDLPGEPWRLHVASRSQGLVALLTAPHRSHPLFQVEVSEEGLLPATPAPAIAPAPCRSSRRPFFRKKRAFCNLYGLPFAVRCDGLPFHCSFRFQTAVARLRIDLFLSEEHVEMRGWRWRPDRAAKAEIQYIVDGIRLLGEQNWREDPSAGPRDPRHRQKRPQLESVPGGARPVKVPAPTKLAGVPAQ